MLGAVAGDIIGSSWEGSSCAELPLPLITDGSVLTDDTVCTIAIADALLRDIPFDDALRMWVRRYPGRGYGGAFYTWAHAEAAPAYNSFANGGAMRVSPVALVASSEDEVLSLAEKTACVTHNHPEGIQGAKAIALAIWFARQEMPQQEIRRQIQDRFGYDLRASVQARAENYGFSVLASETVPDALVSALEATSFEGAIRNAIAIGGDSDTIACMAGGIAEALFGMPKSLAKETQAELPQEMQDVLTQLYSKAGLSMPLRFEQPVPPSEQRVKSQLSFVERLAEALRSWNART